MPPKKSKATEAAATETEVADVDVAAEQNAGTTKKKSALSGALSRAEIAKQKANEAKKKMLATPVVTAPEPETKEADEQPAAGEEAAVEASTVMTRTKLAGALAVALAVKKAEARIGPNGKKKRRSRPGMKALREIRDQQRSIKLNIKRAPFFRLMCEICQDLAKNDPRFENIRWKKSAKDDLQEIVEDFIVNRFAMIQKLSIHGGHETIMERDAILVNVILNEMRLRFGLTGESFNETPTVPFNSLKKRDWKSKKRRAPKKRIDVVKAPKKAIEKKPKVVKETVDGAVEEPKIAKRTKKQKTREALAAQEAEASTAAMEADGAPVAEGKDDDVTELTGDEPDQTLVAPLDSLQTQAIEDDAAL
jgi:histone H3/H4